jgi:hypothetical protein
VLLPASVVGYDVMVCVGVKRFVEHRQVISVYESREAHSLKRAMN